MDQIFFLTPALIILVIAFMKNPKKIYLDYNATTPVDPRVLEAMIPYFSEKFGNASSSDHLFGWEAEEAVDVARDQIAGVIGARPNEIYFTSGATEAINLAFMGICDAYRENGNHIITCVTEHHAVLDTCHQLQQRGFEVTYLEVDKDGTVDLRELQNSIKKETILVSLMHANNEIGVIHPLKEIAELVKEGNAILMTDATQSVGKIPFDVNDLDIDVAAFSAHKLYGPKGVGALYVRNRPKVKVSSYLFGGGQERGLRPGTINVPGIVGFGKAVEICMEEVEHEASRLRSLRDAIEKELLMLEGAQINGRGTIRLPHMTNISFRHIDETKLISSLKRLAVSRGSACASTTIRPSHVLKGLGLSDQLALSSIRMGLGRVTTKEEIRIAIETIKAVIENLRLTTT
jgi:cysteine desulfurase